MKVRDVLHLASGALENRGSVYRAAAELRMRVRVFKAVDGGIRLWRTK